MWGAEPPHLRKVRACSARKRHQALYTRSDPAGRRALPRPAGVARDRPRRARAPGCKRSLAPAACAWGAPPPSDQRALCVFDRSSALGKERAASASRARRWTAWLVARPPSPLLPGLQAARQSVARNASPLAGGLEARSRLGRWRYALGTAVTAGHGMQARHPRDTSARGSSGSPSLGNPGSARPNRRRPPYAPKSAANPARPRRADEAP